MCKKDANSHRLRSISRQYYKPSPSGSSMIRIVGIQKDDNIGREFVLLQNHGSMRVNLRGHAIVSEAALVDGTQSPAVHLFSDDVSIMPGQFVLLRTCPGSSHWSTTNEGQRVYYTHMGRLGPVWCRSEGPVHVLAPQHSFCERATEALLV